MCAGVRFMPVTLQDIGVWPSVSEERPVILEPQLVVRESCGATVR